jgi:hypothetical protein
MAEQPSERMVQSHRSPDRRYRFKSWDFLIAVALLATVLGCFLGVRSGEFTWAAAGVIIGLMAGGVFAALDFVTRYKWASSSDLSDPSKSGAAIGSFAGVMSVVLMVMTHRNLPQIGEG